MSMRRVLRSLSRGRSDRSDDSTSSPRALFSRFKSPVPSVRVGRDPTPLERPHPKPAPAEETLSSPTDSAPDERAALVHDDSMGSIGPDPSGDVASNHSDDLPLDSSRSTGPNLLHRRVPDFECVATNARGFTVYNFDSRRPAGKFTVLCLFSAAEDFERCQSKMFKMEELFFAYRRQGDCQFIAISKGQSAEELRTFRAGRECTLALPMAPDPHGRIFSLFGDHRLPQFYLLDERYYIVHQSFGFLSYDFLTQSSLQYQEGTEYECNIKGVKADVTMKAAAKAAFPQPIAV